MRYRLKRQQTHTRHIVAGITVFLVVTASAVIVLATRAALPAVSIEAEDGTPVGVANVVDSTASRSKAVQFNSLPIGGVPDPIYGWTVDSVDNTNNIVAALKASPKKLTTRVVFDEGTDSSDYLTALQAIKPHSYVLGEILDSSSLKTISLQNYHNRTEELLRGLGPYVDIWEIGNEVNGDWTGNYADVSTKITDAYNQVEAAGKKSFLTLFYTDECDAGLGSFPFSRQYVSESMRSGLDYVMVSHYETQCNNRRPSRAEWTAYFQELHQLYPNAKLGFSEVGIPDPATSSTLNTAKSILDYYYALGILAVPNYVGGYFWWYGYQDFLPVTANKPLWHAFLSGIQKY